MTAQAQTGAEKVAYNAVSEALRQKGTAFERHPQTSQTASVAEKVGAALNTTVDFDLETYRSKEAAYEAELTVIDEDRAKAETQIAAWNDKLDRLTHRRTDVAMHLKAARAAKRALEDGAPLP